MTGLDRFSLTSLDVFQGERVLFDDRRQVIVVSLQLQLEPVVDLVAGVRRRFVVVGGRLLQNLDQFLLVVILLSSWKLII